MPTLRPGAGAPYNALSISLDEKGDIDGVATLDSNGKVPLDQIPAVPSYHESATGTASTTSHSDVLVGSMSVTPAEGKYLVWFSGSVAHSTNNALSLLSIFLGGSKVPDTERKYKRGVSNVQVPFCISTEIEANGSQAVEGRWSTDNGTVSMHERSLTLLKIG